MMNFLLFWSRYNAVCLEGINGGQCVPSCANGVFNNEVNSFRCDGLDLYIYIYIDMEGWREDRHCWHYATLTAFKFVRG